MGSKSVWLPQPENWSDLAYTINMEDTSLDYDPSKVEEASDELLNKFL